MFRRSLSLSSSPGFKVARSDLVPYIFLSLASQTSTTRFYIVRTLRSVPHLAIDQLGDILIATPGLSQYKTVQCVHAHGWLCLFEFENRANCIE